MFNFIIVKSVYLCNYIKNCHRPPNSDELNIDCLPVGDSPRKPHNLKVLQSDTSKLKKQIKMLTVNLNNTIFIYMHKIRVVYSIQFKYILYHTHIPSHWYTK